MKTAFLILNGRLGNHFYILSAANYLQHNEYNVIIILPSNRITYFNNQYVDYLNNFYCLNESTENYELIFSNINHIVNCCDNIDDYISNKYDNSTLYFNISYFQINKYFLKYKEEMLNIFKYESSKINDYLNNLNVDNAVFISARRGDYIGSKFYVLNSQYYIDMYNKYFMGKDVFISCDDIEWAKHNLLKYDFICCKNIYYIDDLLSIEIFNFATNFKNYICSNSSFSSMCELSSKYNDKISIGVPNISPIYYKPKMFSDDVILIDISNEKNKKYIDKITNL